MTSILFSDRHYAEACQIQYRTENGCCVVENPSLSEILQLITEWLFARQEDEIGLRHPSSMENIIWLKRSWGEVTRLILNIMNMDYLEHNFKNLSKVAFCDSNYAEACQIQYQTENGYCVVENPSPNEMLQLITEWLSARQEDEIGLWIKEEPTWVERSWAGLVFIVLSFVHFANTNNQ